MKEDAFEITVFTDDSKWFLNWDLHELDGLNLGVRKALHQYVVLRLSYNEALELSKDLKSTVQRVKRERKRLRNA